MKMPKYINADELIKAIETELWDWETVDGIKSSTVLKQTISDIKNMPAADVVEVRRGHWKTHTKQAYTTPPFTYKIIECSLCRNPVQKYWNFCPWCGADMRGDKR